MTSTTHTSSGAVTPGPGAYDDGFDAYLKAVRDRFASYEAHQPLFTTDAVDLFTTYLASFPREWRQFHNCNACRHFINRYGGIVHISENGRTVSALWNPGAAPPAYRAAIAQLKMRAEMAKVTGVFLTSERVLGTPQSVTHRAPTTPTNWDGSRIWTHFHVHVAKPYKALALNADQRMAELREDYRTLQHALTEYRIDHLNTAVHLLESEALYRSDKVLGPAKWLFELREQLDASRHPEARANLLWRAVAEAPAGFCHPRSSMIGTLLDDISAGLPFETVKRKFAEKMNPLQYQRPQAPPAAGNIAAAEKLVEKLGIAKSLERRFARLHEIPKLWMPPVEPQPSGEGVFGHIQPKGKKKATPSSRVMNVEGGDITWAKFQKDVLPRAEAIEAVLPPARGPFYAFVTAAHRDAPPIIQWDHENERNPVTWYTTAMGGECAEWNLGGKRTAKVTAVTEFPMAWSSGTYDHHTPGVLFVLEGCRDQRNYGGSLFPEFLKSELHQIRATVEAHSRSMELKGRNEADVCGLAIRKGSARHALTVVVTAGATRTTYRIDRWE